VDAFTDKPFSGNPAAVCILDTAQAQGELWMQAVAREMNLSETAFVVPLGADFDLRWFTPTIEVALCGHATLASAHILWEEGILSPGDSARFHTRSGLLTATRRDLWITLDFPAEPAGPVVAPPALLEALGVPPVYVGKNRFDYLVEVASEEILRSIQPNFALLSEVSARGVMVTSRSTHPSFDFVSRFFGPRAGIPEDPVTGSAHCCLGPYWGTRLQKNQLLAYQASSRGGVVRVQLAGPRVLLGGQSVTTLRGEWMIRPSSP
jgi:PhzF family phenazine biosynthesis protein